MSTRRLRLSDACERSAIDGSAYWTSPVFPCAEWDDGKLLADMLCGDHLSVETIDRRYGKIPAFRYIHWLRRIGWPIERSEVCFPDPRDGKQIQLTLYFLPPAVIAATGASRAVFLEKVRLASLSAQAKGGA